ncbi:MAG TPA: YbhB/YbcL family Raf kinase inhibitor-like protein [Polyangiaceae bacterium]|jgi:hypothetical protein|nr:YbhB/YbcL family Raf kinase inhibitor-like protein [Polyangiaceae bacterium]
MELTHRLARFAGTLLTPLRAGDEKLVISRMERGRTIDVSADDFLNGGALPGAHAGKNAKPPGLSWAALPSETREVVIVCEDPDAPLPKPFAHWIVYGIPPTTRSYPPAGEAETTSGVAKTGKNSKRALDFAGATPPPGHGVHHYHFQVFALDAALPLGPGADRDAVVAAMKGHILASGEVIGTFEAN